MNCQRLARAAEEPGPLSSVQRDVVTGTTQTNIQQTGTIIHTVHLGLFCD